MGRAADPSRELADVLVNLAHSDPERATTVALEVLSTDADPGARSVAERALGLAARERHDLPRSIAHLRSAVRLADDAGLATLAAETRVSLAGTLAAGGDWPEAYEEADRAAPALRGPARARLDAQVGWMLMAQGRLDESLDRFRGAIPVLRRAGDRLWEGRALANRGLAYFRSGDLKAAETDLRAAEAIFADLGQVGLTATTRENVGLVVGLAGDVPEALRCFERADEATREHGHEDAMGLTDRGEVFLAARLLPEARSAFESALVALDREGRAAYAAMTRLNLAEVAIEAVDYDLAIAAASEARRAFVQQGLTAWAALSSHLMARAAWRRGDRSAGLLRLVRRAAAELSAAQFTLYSLDAHLLAYELANDLGRRRVAQAELAGAAAARRRGTVAQRARAWHAEALVRLARGDRRGAESALRAGITTVERYRAVLGATELRAHAAGHVTDLARLGLRLAIEDANPQKVLIWAERWRAGALSLRPVRPPDDSKLAASLAELRSIVADVESAVLAGRPTAKLVARQVETEKVVRDRARLAKGVLAASLGPQPGCAALHDVLGERAFIEIVDDHGQFHAVVLACGRATLHPLGPRADMAGDQQQLRFSLRRLAHTRGSADVLAAHANAAAATARRLDERLLGPLRARIGDRALVVVPTGELHALPWAALPSCLGRSVTIAPSASAWYRAAVSVPAAGHHDRPVVLVAGPGLEHAGDEVAALARQYRGCTRLTGGRATCEAVSAALSGARLAHIAAHGEFRADNPLFSCLRLADGPLTVYDLEAIREPPWALVLSACDSGLSDVRPGDELMGLAGAVLAIGTQSLVASLFPVPDDATRRLMVSFHRELRSGATPAAGLARAQVGVASEGHAGLAAAAAFACFGSGG